MQNIDSTIVTNLKLKDVEHASSMLAEAFMGSNFGRILNNDFKRTKQVFKFFLIYTLKYGFAYRSLNDLSGISTWLPSEKVNKPILPVIWSMGLNSIKDVRILDAINLYKREKQVQKIHKDLVPYNHIYLTFVATRKNLQGSGYGSKHILEVLTIFGNSNLDCYTETYEDCNIAIFQKLGFKLIGENYLKKFDIKVYSLLRKLNLISKQ